MTQNVTLEDTPTPSEPLIRLLKSHLPHSLPVLRRLQFALNFTCGRTPQTHVLYAYYAGTAPEGDHFAAGCIDLSRAPETQLWIYSSLERRANTINNLSKPDGTGDGHQIAEPTKEEEDRALPLVLTLLRRIRTIAEASYNNSNNTTNGEPNRDDTQTQEIPQILVGSLHETIRQSLLARRVRMYKAPAVPEELDWEFCGKWLFRVEDFPPLPQHQRGDGGGRDGGENGGLPEGMRWDRIRKGDVGVVLARTSIKRTEATLLMLPSTVVRLEDGTPVAWAFMGLDGTIITLHVEEPYRQRGLAKALACKLMRAHIHEYGDDGWGAADVFEGNHKSQALCRSIGGKNCWTNSWAMLDISSVGDPL